MISMSEVLKGAKLEDQTQEVRDNLTILLERINEVRKKWAKPMTVTSGLRTRADQIRVYAAKGITDEKRIPFGSQHLKGAALDVYDPEKELQDWCKANEALLESIGLWMEDFSVTPNWCHFQIYSPRSGKRWFMP